MVIDPAPAQRDAGEAISHRRMVNFVRRAAYICAVLFMAAMAGNGVVARWNQLDADAQKSVSATAATLNLISASGGTFAAIDFSRVLGEWPVPGLSMELQNADGKHVAAFGIQNEGSGTVIATPINRGQMRLIAKIDRQASLRAAFAQNIGSILFILALGVPVIISFFYLRKTIHQPAFDLIDYVHSDTDDLQPVPSLGGMWRPAIDRLRELRTTRLQFKAFFSHVPAAMYLKNLDNEYVLINDLLASQYKLTPADMIGHQELGFLEPELQERIRKFDAHILATKEPVIGEFRFAVHDGYKDGLTARFPILDPQGEITHIGGIIFDVTGQRQAERELLESKAMFEAFIQKAPNPMTLMKARGQYVMINEVAAEYFGRPSAEMIAAELGWAKDYFPDYEEKLAPLVSAMYSDPTTRKLEIDFRLPSGEIRSGDATYFPILDADGGVAYIGNIWMDMTEERLAKHAAHESQTLVEAFIQNAPNSMALMKPNGQYVMLNNAAAAYYGKTPEELLALGPKVLNAPFADSRSVIVPMMGRVIETLTTETVETPFVMETGETHEISFTLFPVMGAGGELAYIGNISHDLAEARQAQAALAKSTEALHQSEKLAALGQLLAGVAHELNNPLAIVMGRAAILKEKLADSPHADSIQKLRDAADRCARIVKTFLAMARQTGPRRSIVQINELIAGALDMTAYGLRTADIEMVQALDPALPMIDADEDQIVQLLINLIVNAQHALEGQSLEEQKGPRRLTVSTRLDKKARAAVIEVADNGPGIPADVALRIFDPFFTTKGVGEGTGLGLSVCKGMVEAHGGTLSHHETRDGGATFRATLPLGGDMVTQSEADVGGARTAAGHILIVDDEPEIAAILADCLAPLGLSCEIAGDGLTALTLLGTSKFDAIFCDVRMPGMDGITFLAKLKAEHPDISRRLAFVSGDVLHRDLVRLKAASDRLIIEKPFDPQLVRDIALLLLAPAGDPQ